MARPSRLAKAIESTIGAADSEPGTIFYIAHTLEAEPDTLVFYELYESEEALKAHGSGEVVKAIGKVAGEFVGGRAELQILTPFAGKGL